MLEVTILKVKHEGIQEAQKLLPHIQRTDIFAPENAAMCEEDALLQEEEWQKILQHVPRSKFLCMAEQVHEHLELEQQVYIIKRDDYLFRNKTLLWYLERFARQRADEVNKANRANCSLYSRALDCLEHHREEQFLNLLESHLKEESWLYKVRDFEIARNLEEAESRLRGRYPLLKNKDPLVLTVEVGARHFPERYLSFSSRIVDLTDAAPKDCIEILNKMIRDGRPFREMHGIAIEVGQYDLKKRKLRQKNIHTDP